MKPYTFLKHRITCLSDGADFFLPLVNREWLLCLQDDSVSGIRLKASVRLPKDVLGFSFSSNSVGLRGWSGLEADKVLVGTSYAMGFAVDDGKNWWDYALDDDWSNLALPVGVNYIEGIYKSIYKGGARLAVVLYHPNFWQLSKQHLAQADSCLPVSKYLGWQTDEDTCQLLQGKVLKYREEKVRSGRAVAFITDDIINYLDPDVYAFDFGNSGDVDQILGLWFRLLSNFDSVVLIRAHSKHELCPPTYLNSSIELMKRSFEAGWHLFSKHLSSKLRRVKILVPNCIRYEHYYPVESHWTTTGNERFAEWFSKLQL